MLYAHEHNTQLLPGVQAALLREQAEAEARRRKQQEEAAAEAERRRQQQQKERQEQAVGEARLRRQREQGAEPPASAPAPAPASSSTAAVAALAAPSASVNPLAEQLAEMGFPLSWCQRALDAVGGGAVGALGAALGAAGAELLLEEALNWILANGELLAEEEDEEDEGEEEEEEEEGEAKEGEGTEHGAPPPTPAPGAAAPAPAPAPTPAPASGLPSGEEEEPEPSHARPRLYHVDPSAELFLTMYEAPSLESEPVHTVFSGEELYVVERRGADWLCVNLDYVPEEDEVRCFLVGSFGLDVLCVCLWCCELHCNNADGTDTMNHHKPPQETEDEDDDEDDDEDEDEEEEEDDEEEEDYADALAWIRRRSPDGHLVVLPGPPGNPLLGGAPSSSIASSSGGAGLGGAGAATAAAPGGMATSTTVGTQAGGATRAPPAGPPSSQQAAAGAGAQTAVDAARSLLDFLGGGPRASRPLAAAGAGGSLPSMLPPPAEPDAGAFLPSADTVWYRVTERGGLQVRQGLEPHSPSLAILPPGAALAASEEAVDSRGAARVRLASPPHACGGWVGKRPGALERLGQGPEPPAAAAATTMVGEGYAEEAEAVAAAAAFAGLEDALEEETGNESFRREDRFFPPAASSTAGRRGSVSLRSAPGTTSGGGATRYIPSYLLSAYANSAVGGSAAQQQRGTRPGVEAPGVAARPARRLRAGGSDTLQGSWRLVAEQARAPAAVNARLTRALGALHVLLARQLALALLLSWQEEAAAAAGAAAGDGGQSLLARTLLSSLGRGTDGPPRALARGANLLFCSVCTIPIINQINPIMTGSSHHLTNYLAATNENNRPGALPPPRGLPRRVGRRLGGALYARGRARSDGGHRREQQRRGRRRRHRVVSVRSFYFSKSRATVVIIINSVAFYPVAFLSQIASYHDHS